MNEEYLNVAFSEAFSGTRSNDGGPFGSVVVKDGKIIGKGHNSVTSTNDPTAHAEVMAIRDACRNLGSFDLSGAEIYATCEPCPMCMSAIYWSRIETVYYCSTRHDAAAIGFDDNLIYEELKKGNNEKLVRMRRVDSVQAQTLFNEWGSLRL